MISVRRLPDRAECIETQELEASEGSYDRAAPRHGAVDGVGQANSNGGPGASGEDEDADPLAVPAPNEIEGRQDDRSRPAGLH